MHANTGTHTHTHICMRTHAHAHSTLRYSWPHLGQFNELMPVNYSLRCGWLTKLCLSLSVSLSRSLSLHSTLFYSILCSLYLPSSVSPSQLINSGGRTRGRERAAISIYCNHGHYWCLAALQLEERTTLCMSACVCACVCLWVCVGNRKLLNH